VPDPTATFTVVQATTLVAFLLTLVVVAIYFRLTTSFRAFTVPFFLWSLHGAVYYAVLGWSYATASVPIWHDHFNFQTWSAVLRLHGAFTVLAISVSLLVELWLDRRQP
jgi:hypothetical protein